MSQLIEIHWTSGSLEEARKVARLLVQDQLVASAQIIPWIESVYLWNNQMETDQESKIIFKTALNHYEKIKEIILKNCAYEIPEITYIHIDGGNKEYLSWIESTQSAKC